MSTSETRDDMQGIPPSALPLADALVAGPDTEDESDPAEGSPTTVGITSGVYANMFRRYHTYKHGRYPIPTEGLLFYAPIGAHPSGTGTGKRKEDR